MKRIVALCICIVIFFISTSALADIDLSSMSFDELIALQQQVNKAIWASDEWQEVEVPAGLYRVGVDIPAGNWKVSMKRTWARIKLGSEINETGNEVSYSTKDYYSVQINEDVPSQVIHFTEGMYVEIYNASLIFSSATGAQFNFK